MVGAGFIDRRRCFRSAKDNAPRAFRRPSLKRIHDFGCEVRIFDAVERRSDEALFDTRTATVRFTCEPCSRRLAGRSGVHCQSPTRCYNRSLRNRAASLTDRGGCWGSPRPSCVVTLLAAQCRLGAFFMSSPRRAGCVPPDASAQAAPTSANFTRSTFLSSLPTLVLSSASTNSTRSGTPYLEITPLSAKVIM